MNVIEVNPRGFCHGVVSAMQLVTQTLSDPTVKRPIYIIGDIVHNSLISKAYEESGAITLNGKTRREILEKVDSGTVILTAHGIDPHLITYAKNKGLNVVDATCCDVTRTHEVINEHLLLGYDILYIGKEGHPEPEAAVGICPQHVHLISSISDIDNLDISNDKLILTNQTTLSMWSLKDIIDYAEFKFPNIKIIKEICDATKLRQEAVLDAAKKADLTIVVGDPKSNNTKKLVEISEVQAGTKAIRITNLNDLDINYLLDENVTSIAITSGASTPSLITKDVIKFVKEFEKDDKSTHDINYEINYTKIIPRRKMNLYNKLDKQYQTPYYLYDKQQIESNIKDLLSVIDLENVKINYAVKANSNVEILKIVKSHNMKVDSTGINEVLMNKYAGFTNENIYCVGNNFDMNELKALVEQDIIISIDSISQIELLGKVAPGYKKVLLRMNPSFGAGANEQVTTGGKKTKFGIDYDRFDIALDELKKYNLELYGVNQHIGSAYLEHESLIAGVKSLLEFINDNNINGLQMICFGGGFGFNYEHRLNDNKMDFNILKTELTKVLKDFLNKYDNKDVSLEFEPGRYVVASAGKLVGTVTSIKERVGKYIIGTNLGFNQFIRPVLYGAYHEIDIISDSNKMVKCDVVGNLCESGDYMGKNRLLPLPKLGDLVVVHDVGAYGYCLSSNYNSRLRPIELLKDNDNIKVIRRRQTFEDLINEY